MIEPKVDYVSDIFRLERLEALKELNVSITFYVESILKEDELHNNLKAFLLSRGFETAQGYAFHHDTLPTIIFYNTLLAPATLRGTTLFGAIVSKHSVNTNSDRLLKCCFKSANIAYKKKGIQPVNYLVV